VPTVVLIGTLDTKGREYAFVRELLHEAGVETHVVDVGVLGEPPFGPDVSAAEVARLGGAELAQLRFTREGSDTRAHALAVMGRGAAELLRRLRAEGRCDGVLGLAGSGGSMVIADAMRALPVGLPKLLVTTMASTPAGADYVGTSDLTLMSPVTDVAGLNRVSRAILANAAAAIAGMVSARRETAAAEDRPLVALTMMGVTTPCVLHVQRGLERAGYETIVFHAVGTGGRALEEMVADGLIDAVCDVTTHELADHELGGIFDAGPDRLVAIARLGLPLVAVPGALEFVNFGPRETVPAALQQRPIVVHNPSVCAVRVDRDEAARLGRVFAEKVNESTGPAAVVLPLRGCSSYSAPGGPFVDDAADRAMFDAIRAVLRPEVELAEIHSNLNEAVAAELILELMLGRLHR
jgi:uncharacterized protein (UPF0261 family)